MRAVGGEVESAREQLAGPAYYQYRTILPEILTGAIMVRCRTGVNLNSRLDSWYRRHRLR